MRRTYWYHEECLFAFDSERATRTSKSPHHELCARCGYEGLCVEAELVTNPDVRKIEVGQELKAAAEALAKVAVEAKPAEETEAVEEAVTEAVEAVVEEVVEAEEAPEETVVEAKPEPCKPVAGDLDELAEALPEEGKDSFEVAAEGYAKEQMDARNAKIAALEAEIEALKK